MWWVWLVPGLAVAASVLVLAVSAREAWQRFRRVRRSLDELTGDARAVQALVDRVEAAAPQPRTANGYPRSARGDRAGAYDGR